MARRHCVSGSDLDPASGERILMLPRYCIVVRRRDLFRDALTSRIDVSFALLPLSVQFAEHITPEYSRSQVIGTGSTYGNIRLRPFLNFFFRSGRNDGLS